MKPIFKRMLSGLLSLAMTVSAVPIVSAHAEESTEPYPYTMFAASNSDGSITINANNVCVNGNIATNGTIVTTSPNFNVNGTKTESANEEMIYIQKKLNYSYFSGDNIDVYVEDYSLEDLNININNPMDVYGSLELTGNINLNSGIKAYEDVIVNGDVKNTNEAVIYSETGDINITNTNVNFNGLIYAPYGDIVIDTDNLNLNNVVIIGQTITLDCPNVNVNYSHNTAELVGIESDIEVELYAMGEYSNETNSIDIEWYTNYENSNYEIWTSNDNEEYTSVDVVTDETTYQYLITDDLEKIYFKVSLTTNYGKYIESVPFAVTKTEDGYSVDFLDSDEDGLPDIYEIMIGTDVNVPDTDSDGLTDYQEVYITETDPTVYDSVTEGISDADVDPDSDGLTNIEEIKLGTDSLCSDTDGDDISDYDEVNVTNTDPLSKDTDGDGIKDSTELRFGLDPNDPETFGYPDSEYQVEQNLSADNDVFISVNNDNSPYSFSIDIVSGGDVEENIMIEESRMRMVVNEDTVLDNGVDVDFTNSCTPTKIILNYVINNEYIENELNCFSSIERFDGIKRFGVFKYFDEIKALLPIYTEYDVDNNKISASVEGNGTYFVLDMEKWLNDLGVTEYDLMAAENSDENTDVSNTPAPMKMPNVKIFSAKDSSSAAKIGKGTTGNFFESKPIDLVFAIQKCGLGNDAKIKFEFEKKLIRDLSNYAFNKYGNVRIHIVAYDLQWDNSNVLTDGSSVFFDIKAVEKALDSIKYNDKIIGSANRALGHYLAFTNCKYSYRRDTTWFVYNLTNSSTYFLDVYGNYSYDFQSVYDYFWHNGMYYSQVIDGGNDFDTTLNNLIYNDFTGITDSTAISYIKGKVGVDLKLDLSSKSNYNSLVNNLDMNVNPKSLYGAYSSIDWTKKILDGELSEDRKLDTDKDGIPDWDEVDTSKLVMHSDGSFDLPTIGDFIDKIKSDYEKEKVKAAIIALFSSTSKPDAKAPPLEITNIADMIVNIKILPFDSDPTNPDDDGDGYWDIEDPEPLNTPEYLGKEYDFLDNEIYIISPMDTSKALVLDIDEYLVEEGDQVILSSPDKYIINSKFKFEWCRNGYKICPLEPLFGEDLVLSFSLNDNGTGNVTVEKDSNSEEQLWEIVPYVNKDREIIQQQVGLVIRSKKLYYNKTENRYEPLYLSYRNDKVEVSTERALGTRFKLENIVDDWKRFGSIYTDVVGWTDYPYNHDKIRAMKNYKYNTAIGLKEKTDSTCIVDGAYLIDDTKYGENFSLQYSNIFNELGTEFYSSLKNYRLLWNQYGGNFPKLKYVNTDSNNKYMDYSCCEIMATFNLLSVAGIYNVKDTVGKITNDIDQYFKLATEFELSNLMFGQVITTGRWGSKPSGIGKCLSAYNVSANDYEFLTSDADDLDNMIKNTSGFAIISTFSGPIHTFFVFYDSSTDEFVAINRGSGNLYGWKEDSIKDILNGDILVGGHVLL